MNAEPMTIETSLACIESAPPVCLPTIDLDSVVREEDVGPAVREDVGPERHVRVATAETVEPGSTIVFHNEFHDTTAKCTVRKNATISARVYRRICVDLCEAAKIRDTCSCNGPHGDPQHVLIPLGHPLDRCEWHICKRPASVAPSRAAEIATQVGRFTFLVAVPYMVAGVFVLSWALLRRLPRAVWFLLKTGIVAAILGAAGTLVVYMNAAMR
jgi:hypothetical protein